MAQSRILVVEDEVIVADDIRRSLKNLGYDVPSIVSSGEAAIKKAEEDRPDLVLMDIMLQGKMDGIEAAGNIISRFDIPVVYLTAYSDEKILERAKITEPFGYLIKPYKDRELEINIEIALYKHRTMKELKDSRKWFHGTLNSISDAVIATDPKGCVIFMNPPAQDLTGWTLEEAQGKPLKEVFDIASEVTQNKGIQTILMDKNKTKIQIQSSNNIIKDDRGNIIGIVLVFRVC